MFVSMKTRACLKDKILSYLAAHQEEQIQFVIKLCNQNSFTANKDGVDRVATMILEQAEELFWDHETVYNDSIGDFHLLKTAQSDKFIFLVGHMDTVFPPEHPFQKCQLEGDTLKGPGTGDMKGGLGVIIYALKALKEVGCLDQAPLCFVLTSDEEAGSPQSHTFLTKERDQALACLVAECAGLNNEIVVSRNGKLGMRIDCYGQDRHVGLGTHEKSSAILELAHKIVSLESLNASLPGVSLNVGKVEGGLGPSTIPGKASALIDLRWVDEDHRKILIAKIEQILANTEQQDCSSSYEILNSRPAMPQTEISEKFFQLVKKTGRDLGQSIPPEHRRGTSDANFFGSVGIPTLDGLGPVCDKDHTPQEHIMVSSLVERSALLALLLAKYGRRISALRQ
jgi:glutamate carboxypeptidase